MLLTLMKFIIRSIVRKKVAEVKQKFDVHFNELTELLDFRLNIFSDRLRLFVNPLISQSMLSIKILEDKQKMTCFSLGLMALNEILVDTLPKEF